MSLNVQRYFKIVILMQRVSAASDHSKSAFINPKPSLYSSLYIHKHVVHMVYVKEPSGEREIEALTRFHRRNNPKNKTDIREQM